MCGGRSRLKPGVTYPPDRNCWDVVGWICGKDADPPRVGKGSGVKAGPWDRVRIRSIGERRGLPDGSIVLSDILGGKKLGEGFRLVGVSSIILSKTAYSLLSLTEQGQ